MKRDEVHAKTIDRNIAFVSEIRPYNQQKSSFSPGWTSVRTRSLKRSWLRDTKRAFTTRRVPTGDMRKLIVGDAKPKAGDLVLAMVDELGSHQRVELPNGRRAKIIPGDLIMLCYGNRYAPDQFEAVVSDDLGTCDLIAAGGIAGRELCRHERMDAPTKIIPIGLVANERGKRLNVFDYRLDLSKPGPRIPVVVVFGTAMNSGKTMTAGSLVRGLATSGLKVAGIKSTGTGSGGDLWFMSDMGASVIADFTDAGMPSTYLAPPEQIEAGILGLIDHAANEGCHVAVVEIADGLQHEETAALLRSKPLRERICGVVFAAYDALGAQAGVEALRANRHKILGLSGQVARSPLAMRETLKSTGTQVYSPLELQAGLLNEQVLAAGETKGALLKGRLAALQSRKRIPTPAIERQIDITRFGKQPYIAKAWVTQQRTPKANATIDEQGEL